MKSFTERNPVVIGVIVVALIGAATGAAVLLNGGAFRDRHPINARFVDSAGLRAGDKVRLAGVTVGEVASVRQKDGKVNVTLHIDDGIDLPQDTRAAVVVETLLGSKYVRLTAGTDWDRLLEPGATITDTQTPTEILDLQNVGTPLLEDLDGKSLNDLLDKLNTVSSGQRRNVADIVTGLDDLTTAVNDRQQQARDLIDSANTVTGTLSARDQDLLAAIDNVNVVLDSLAARRVELVALIQRTKDTATKTGALITENRPEIDAVLAELHEDLAIVGRRQTELAATMSGLTNAIGGFASIGYSGPDRYPNSWANMYTQLLGPVGPDALFGSCGLLDDALDLTLGADPITDCTARTGPLPHGSTVGAAPTGTGPLDTLFGPLVGQS